MDANYVIKRIRIARYKYHTVEILRNRLNNLETTERQQIMANLKMELWKTSNADIYDPLMILLYRKTMAA